MEENIKDSASFSCLMEKALTENPVLRETFPEAVYPAFEELCSLLLTENEVMNLTAVREPYSVIVRHFLDSATAVKFIPQNACLCDVGCGGGYPTLPIAVLRPDVQVTAVDSTEKKLRFVAQCAEALHLQNVIVLPARAEELGQNPAVREQFDVVTARAVAALPTLAEWCIPLVKKGGTFLAMKGAKGMEEMVMADNAVKTLGAVLSETDSAPLYESGERQERTILVYHKRQFTPKQYPRRNAEIRRKPL